MKVLDANLLSTSSIMTPPFRWILKYYSETPFQMPKPGCRYLSPTVNPRTMVAIDKIALGMCQWHGNCHRLM